MALGSIHLTPQLVQAVRDAVDIVDVAGEMTRLKRRGSRHLGLCPFHKEKTPSFSIDPGPGLFYCFGCGMGGDAIKLYMQHTGDDFPAAIEALARRYGIPLPAAPAAGRGRERRDLGQALEAAAAFFAAQLARSEFAQRYLDQRRISPALRQRYGLGYAPDGWDNLLVALRGRVPLEDLIAAGLVGRSEKTGNPYDRFRQRLMFPIHAPSGRLVGFGGRTLGDDVAKYVNTAETEHFHKGRLLYGLHQAKRALRDGGRALLVEGYFDVLGAVASGIEWAVAGMGTALGAEQAQLLARYVDDVTVAYDGDEAGEKAFRRALPILLSAGLSVRRALFPAGHDPDSLRAAEGPAAVMAAVEAAEDGVWLEIRRLTPRPGERTPAAQTRAAAEIAELLRAIRDPIMRRQYAQRAAEHLGVPEDVFLRRLGPQLYFQAPGDEPQRTRDTRSQEERGLVLLLRPSEPLPPPDQLPPVEAFLDPDCRNIYAVFCDLYRGGGRAPGVDEVLAQLSSEGGAIDRVARLLLEDPEPGETGLAETLAHILQRWRKQRLAEVTRQIRQAQEEDDQARLIELLEAKKTLTRTQHPAMDGNWW